MLTDYTIDLQERTVTCRMICDEGTFIGTAQCMKTEPFDEEVGRELAYKRALLQVKKHDIAIFKKKVEQYEEALTASKNIEKRLAKYKKFYKQAKAQLSNIHVGIEKLSNLNDNSNIKKGTENPNEDYVGRYFMETINDVLFTTNGKKTIIRYIHVVEKISTFKCYAYVVEKRRTVCSDLTSQGVHLYFGEISLDKIKNMTEISKEQFQNEAKLNSEF